MSNKSEFKVRVIFNDGKEELYNGVDYHEFYKETLRLRRHPKNHADVFIPLKNVRSVHYVAYPARHGQ